MTIQVTNEMKTSKLRSVRFFAEPLLNEDANAAERSGSSKRQAALELVTEVVVPVMVGAIGVGISVAALAISVLSAIQ